MSGPLHWAPRLMMNLRRTLGLAVKVGMIGILMLFCLGSEYLNRSAFPWQFLNHAQAEVLTAFQTPNLQLPILASCTVYLIGFVCLLLAPQPARCS